MKKKFLSAVLSVSMLASVLTGCGNTDNSSSQSQTPAANTDNADNAAQGDDAQADASADQSADNSAEQTPATSDRKSVV